MLSIQGLLRTPEFRQKYEEGFRDPIAFVRHFLDEHTYNILVRMERVLPTGQIVRGHPGQREWLRIMTAPDIREAALKAGSRSGKSFGTALGHLWHLFYRQRPKGNLFAGDWAKTYRQLSVAPSVDQARIVHDYILELVGRSTLLTAIGFITEVKSGEQPEIRTIMNSLLVSRATTQGGRFILGRYYDVMTFDECASEPQNMVIRNRVLLGRRIETDGRVYYLSTPQGEDGKGGEGAVGFRHIYAELEHRQRQGDHSVDVLTMTAYDNPVNSVEAIERNKQSMTTAEIAREIYGEFALTSDTVFASELIDRAIQRGKTSERIYVPRDHPVDGSCLPDPDAPLGMRYSPRGRMGCRYYHGLDPAGETRADSTVLVTLEECNGRLRVCAFERVGKMTTYGDGGLLERTRRRLSQYPGELCFDATGHQGQLIRQTFEQELDGEMYSRIRGIIANMKPGRSRRNYKELSLAHLLGCLERDLLDIPPDPTDELKQMKRELRDYSLPDDKLSTDCVSALALAAYAHRRDMADRGADYGDMITLVQERQEG